ncbi:hypothetical protein B0H13DRAFT_1917738 [Mycena leptocephala]|nr:hypothetical protein B0H13DRAFT_1917738 [Mycena leptocephala]
MSDSPLDWIWSEYTTSPDPASGMQSLYKTCSWLTKHIILPSHIVLSGGGYALHPKLAQILTNVVPEIGPNKYYWTARTHYTKSSGMELDHAYGQTLRRHGMPQVPSDGRSHVGFHLPNATNPCDTPSFALHQAPHSVPGVIWHDGVASCGKQLTSVATEGRRPRTSAAALVHAHAWSAEALSEAEDGGLVTEAPYRSNVLKWCVSGSTAGNGLVHTPITPCPPHPIATAGASDTPKAGSQSAGPNVSTPNFSYQIYDLVWQRATYIATIKFLDSRDIVDRGANLDSDLGRRPIGRFGLETGFLRMVNNTVNNMQSLLATALSNFLVDPHDMLISSLQGANKVRELQFAWDALSERMGLALQHFKEDQLEYRAQMDEEPCVPHASSATRPLPPSTDLPMTNHVVNTDNTSFTNAPTPSPASISDSCLLKHGGLNEDLQETKSISSAQGNGPLITSILDESECGATRSTPRIRTLQAQHVPGIRSRSRLREHVFIHKETLVKLGGPCAHSTVSVEQRPEAEQDTATLEHMANADITTSPSLKTMLSSAARFTASIPSGIGLDNCVSELVKHFEAMATGSSAVPDTPIENTPHGHRDPAVGFVIKPWALKESSSDQSSTGNRENACTLEETLLRCAQSPAPIPTVNVNDAPRTAILRREEPETNAWKIDKYFVRRCDLQTLTDPGCAQKPSASLQASAPAHSVGPGTQDVDAPTSADTRNIRKRTTGAPVREDSIIRTSTGSHLVYIMCEENAPCIPLGAGRDWNGTGFVNPEARARVNASEFTRNSESIYSVEFRGHTLKFHSVLSSSRQLNLENGSIRSIGPHKVWILLPFCLPTKWKHKLVTSVLLPHAVTSGFDTQQCFCQDERVQIAQTIGGPFEALEAQEDVEMEFRRRRLRRTAVWRPWWQVASKWMKQKRKCLVPKGIGLRTKQPLLASLNKSLDLLARVLAIFSVHFFRIPLFNNPPSKSRRQNTRGFPVPGPLLSAVSHKPLGQAGPEYINELSSTQWLSS